MESQWREVPLRFYPGAAPLSQKLGVLIPLSLEDLALEVDGLKFMATPGGTRLEWFGIPVWEGPFFWATAPTMAVSTLTPGDRTRWVVQDYQGGKLLSWVSPEGKGIRITLRIALLPQERMVIEVQTEGLGTLPVGLEFCLGQFHAGLISGAGMVLDGERHHIPSRAQDPDQWLTGKDWSWSTPVGEINLRSTHPLIHFDARLEGADWARPNPVFWLGRELENSLLRVELGFSQLSERYPTLSEARRPRPWPDPLIIPEPQNLSPTEDYVLPHSIVLTLPHGNLGPALSAIEDLCRDWEALGIQIQQGPEGDIRLEFGEGPSQGYRLWVSAVGVRVVGSDPVGLSYGIQTLRQLITGEGGHMIRGVKIEDWPDLPLRGLHLMADHQALEVHKDLITRLAVPLKLNHILLEAEHVRWDATREIHQEWYMSKEDLAQLVAFANERGITVTPLIQSLGHMEWFFVGEHYRHLAEDPEFCYAVNPSHPQVYAILSAVMEEAAAICASPYLHIGHDEANMIGRFPHQPENMAKGWTRLIGESIEMYRRHLEPLGVKVMVWSDLLLGPGEGGTAHAPTPSDARQLRESLHPDVVVVDWQYWGRKFPSLTALGSVNPVIGGSWDAPDSLASLSQAVAEREGLGMICTTWMGYKTIPHGYKVAPHQFAGYLLQAEYAWTASRPDWRSLPYDPITRVFALWEGSQLSGGRPVDLKQWGNPALTTHRDLSQLPQGSLTLGGVRFALDSIVATGSDLCPIPLPSMVNGIEVNALCMGLVFLQASLWPLPHGTHLGQLRIHFADGGEEAVELVYGRNIHAWEDPRWTPEARLVWLGQGQDGTRLGLSAVHWENPTPQRQVACVDLVVTHRAAGPMLLALTCLE